MIVPHLLEGMGQLVGEQSVAAVCPRSISSLTESDVPPDGVGKGLYCLGRLRGRVIRMHPDVAKVMPETRLEERARRGIERLPGGAQHVVDDRRGFRHPSIAACRVALHQRNNAIERLPFSRRSRHPHHLLGHTVSFLLVLIAWFIDPQFRLQRLAEKFVALALLALPGQPRRSTARALALEDSRSNGST